MTRDQTKCRLTPIVAADFAGYTRLVPIEEDGTLTALRSQRTELIDLKIVKYKCRIANTVGEGILIKFSSVHAV